MKIRQIKAKDIRYLAKVIGPEVGSMRQVVKEDADPTAVGFMLFEKILANHIDEIWGWLADMAGMSSEELDDQPPSAPLEILKAIKASEEFRPLLDALSSASEKDGK